MDKVEELIMSSEIIINDIIEQLKEIADVLSTCAIYLDYSNPKYQEQREAFRNLLISSEEISRQARLVFEELCSLKNNPVI